MQYKHNKARRKLNEMKTEKAIHITSTQQKIQYEYHRLQYNKGTV